jgi:CRISPR-associated endonuclease Cas1
MRTRCDPIDVEAALAALARGEPPLLLYARYSETAARPYARSTWELILRKGPPVNLSPIAPRPRGLDLERYGPIKPSTVLALIDDGPSVSVRSDTLIVRDGPLKLQYERRSAKPEAIVILGWGGIISLQAIRFCADHGIAVLFLDWDRSLLSVVNAPAPRSAAILKRQCAADPLAIGRVIVRSKIEAHAREGAIDGRRAAHWIERAGLVSSLDALSMVEALAAKEAWADRHIVIKWSEAGRVRRSWKLPYSTRRRMGGRKARNATDPINSLLNLTLAIASARITVLLAAHGLSPAIGFMHKAGKWPLAYDAIEPLRAAIERRTFDYIDAASFSPRDFVTERSSGVVKASRPCARRFLAEASPPLKEIAEAAMWIARLVAGDTSGIRDA